MPVPRAPLAVARPPRARRPRRSAAGAIEAREAEAADAADPAAAEPDAAAALDALRRIVRELRVTAANAESETGLTAAQLFVLHQVGAAPGLSLTEIATRTLTDRTSVAAVVDRLLAQSLVERRAGVVDRRRAEIFVTRAGARVLARAPHPPTRLVLDAMTTMSVRERRQLARSLGQLARAMGLSGGDAPMLFEDVARAR
jgi:DNA-binding MarR family transcriptional regulator